MQKSSPLLGVLLGSAVGLLLVPYLNLGSFTGTSAIGLYLADAIVIVATYWAIEKFLWHRKATTHSLMYVFLASLVGLFAASWLDLATLLGSGAWALLVGNAALITVVFWGEEKYLKKI